MIFKGLLAFKIKLFQAIYPSNVRADPLPLLPVVLNSLAGCRLRFALRKQGA